MPVQLNHTIIPSVDKKEAANFLTDLLGLDPPIPLAHFVTVETSNGVSLDYDDRDDVVPGHYAFLVSEEEFDEIFERVTSRGITYWADPMHEREGRIYTHSGRGFYFADPSGHNMEVLTKPYTG
ncbi:MAG: VOC family protein [Acidobacteria bacterium]|nr:VOC family protein [Acidobacteriota bacterium]